MTSKLSTESRLKHERDVLQGMYLASFVERKPFEIGNKSLRFNEIAYLSNVKKSTLQDVLARLVKRRWIRVYRATYVNPNESITGYAAIPYKEKIVGTRIIKDRIFIPEIYEKIKPHLAGHGPKGQRTIFKKIIKKESEYHVFYRIEKFPFIFSSFFGGNESTVPEGTIRFWKNVAKETTLAVKTIVK